MYSWPSTLPQSVSPDYEITPRSGLLSTTEFRNPVRNRTYPEWSATFSMIVSSTQLSTFRTFYDSTIYQSGPFSVPWLESLGFDFHVVRFLNDGPSWESIAAAGYWKLRLPLEIIAGVETDSDGTPNIYPPDESESE